MRLWPWRFLFAWQFPGLAGGPEAGVEAVARGAEGAAAADVETAGAADDEPTGLFWTGGREEPAHFWPQSPPLMLRYAQRWYISRFPILLCQLHMNSHSPSGVSQGIATVKFLSARFAAQFPI